ncbi:MAG: protein kinase domain-containing protein [Myxococcales bacterium]|jgi:serine/threonine protein kinase/tetratricopeptide (TPR) repeat protein
MATLCPSCGVELPCSTNTCPRCFGTRSPEPSSAPDPAAGRIVGGRYRLLRRLGQGGMGVVYVAEHVGAGQKVAIKFLHPAFSSDPEISRRFHNEARSYAQVVHPHAVQLHDFGQDEDGSLYITMELVEGCDLKRTLSRDGRLKPKDALDVALQIADVLGTAHARGIVHRDLKPENVMLTRLLRGYHVKVLDFGLAHLADSATRMTAPGMICGTPRYMAPEQAAGLDIDHRADIYALGLVLFECLTGRHPFDSPSVSETLRRQRCDPVPRLTQVAPDVATEAVDAVIQRATAKAREERFGSMLELAQALSAAIPAQADGGGDADTAATVARAPSRPSAPAPLAPRPDPRAEPGPSGSATHFSTPRPVGQRDNAPGPVVPGTPDAAEHAVPGTPGAAGPAVPGTPEAAADEAANSDARKGGDLPCASPSLLGAAARRLGLFAIAGTVVLLAAVALLAPRLTSGGPSPLGSRATLDGFFRANGEPLPPAACREKSEAALATLLAAAPHLRDAIPENARATEASAALAILASVGVSSPEAAYLLAKARSLAGQPADGSLTAALACPGFAAAENLAANLALKVGQLDEAERRYSAAIAAAPGFTKARFNRAVLKFQQGRVDEAIELLHAVIREQPDHADAHYALGLMRDRKAAAARSVGDSALADRESSAARKAYCKALELGNHKAAGGCTK